MMKAFQSNSYLFGGNAPYVEELYESYLNNPGSVPERWREYFDNLQHDDPNGRWKLYIYDRYQGMAGQLTGSWQLGFAFQ